MEGQATSNSEIAAGRLPGKGKTREQLKEMMAEARRADTDWRQGRVAAYVYYAGDEILDVGHEAYMDFFSANAVGPKAFPSLKQFESEVVSMAAGLLHGEQAVGNISSGGTESNLLAVKTARDRARAEGPKTSTPEMVMPATAHASLNKAAHFLGLKPVRTPVRADFRADLEALRSAITDNTVLIVGSAPGWPHGVIDPIPEMAQIAQERGICFHVDACLGGYLLPFMEKLGYPVRPFDFRVSGVTSISADLHKYGFTPKGASTVLYRDAKIHSYQGFAFDGWPMGLYSSPTLAGTRPGGAIAGAWAVMQYLGEEGYLKLAERIMGTTRALIDGINAIPGLKVWGQPDMSVFAYGSRSFDIHAVADGMSELGWFVNRQVEPPSIHLVATPAHEPIVATYLEDLAGVAARVAGGALKGQGSQVTY